jgi:hypothetical protein
MTLEGRIEDLEDIIKILIDLLKINKLTPDFIKSELRQYHYCYDCMNHFRSCKCGEDSSDSESVDDNYTSSEYSDNDDNN